MMPKECKRLAEVDSLIAVVRKHSARGEVDPAWASLDAPSLVGATAVGGMQGDAAGAITAGPGR